MAENIRRATAPSLIGNPNIPILFKNDFEAAIWNKGYSVIIESAIACPCRGKSGSPKTTCHNCLGLGWVFINPVETKAIISSINKDTKFKYWSPELTGTVNVTVRDEERLSYMDKITFKDGSSIQSEIKPILTAPSGKKFIFCSYKVKKILDIYIYQSDTTYLTKITDDRFTIKDVNKCVIELTGLVSLPVDFNGVVSVEYECELSYNVVDLPHDFRSTFMLDNNGANVEYNLPIQGVARRSHIVLGESTNFDGNNLLVNSDTW